MSLNSYKHFQSMPVDNATKRGHGFRNEAGQTIKHLKGDTRFSRFLNGSVLGHLQRENSAKGQGSAEISRMGKTLAEDDPYIILNGRLRELVIHKPRQLRDFLSKDSQGTFSKHPVNGRGSSLCIDHYKPQNMNLGAYAGK